MTSPTAGPSTDAARSGPVAGTAGPSADAARPRLVEETIGQREDRYRGMLGLQPLGYRLAARTRLWGWLGPLAMAAVAAVLRLVGLNHPHSLVFDETYYVKDAFTLDRFGFATQWDPEDEDVGVNPNFVAGDYHEMTDKASYVVHGDVGKWLIALGMRLFGADNGLGWRFSAAVAGVLCVLLLGRIAFHLFRSAVLATTASGYLALDGVSVVNSRTALLDVFLTLFVLVGLWALLRDRDQTRARLAARLGRAPDPWSDPWGPPTGMRWWLLVAGVALGVAAGVKWSGFYAAAAFGITAFLWDLQARRAVGVRLPVGAAVMRGGIPAFLALVPATLVTYTATWFSWFTHPGAYMRGWAAGQRDSGVVVPRDWLPDTLNSWVQYHLQMLEFHRTLESEHSYMAHPAGWLLQIRPTSYFWEDLTEKGVVVSCGSDRCVQAITSVGNPFVWWFAFLALALVIAMAWRRKDWRAWAILAGYAGTYLPWFLFANRTVFTFYTVVIAPFVVLALVYALGLLAHLLPLHDPTDPSGRAGPQWLQLRPLRQLRRRHRTPSVERLRQPRRTLSVERSRRIGRVTYRVVSALVVLAAAFWWPLWFGVTVPYWFWQLHMWFPSWV